MTVGEIMKILALIMCAICAAIALYYSIEGNSLLASVGLLVSILNGGNYIRHICEK